MWTDGNGSFKYVKILGQMRKLDFSERHYGVGVVCCHMQVTWEHKGVYWSGCVHRRSRWIGLGKYWTVQISSVTRSWVWCMLSCCKLHLLCYSVSDFLKNIKHVMVEYVHAGSEIVLWSLSALLVPEFITVQYRSSNLIRRAHVNSISKT